MIGKIAVSVVQDEPGLLITTAYLEGSITHKAPLSIHLINKPRFIRCNRHGVRSHKQSIELYLKLQPQVTR